MTNLIFVQGCTLSALGLGGYKVVVTLVFIVFCLIGAALAIAEDGPFGVIMALVCGLFAALLIYSLFHPTGSPPTTGGPVEITPVVLIPMIVISVIAGTITVVGAVRKLKEGEFPEIGIFEIAWVTGILVTLGVGILGLFGRGPFALGKDLPPKRRPLGSQEPSTARGKGGGMPRTSAAILGPSRGS